jgi:hypothetical protein
LIWPWVMRTVGVDINERVVKGEKREAKGKAGEDGHCYDAHVFELP